MVEVIVTDKPDSEFEDVLEEAVQDRWICAIDENDSFAIAEEVEAMLLSAAICKAKFLKVMVDQCIAAIAIPRIVPLTLIEQYRKITTINDDCGQPWIIYVKPEYRGQMLGKLIIDYCKTMFSDLMYFPDSKNHKSINLANRNGFVPLVMRHYNPVYHWSKANEIIN